MSRDGIPEALNDKNRNKLAGKIAELDDLAYALGFKQTDIQRFKANNIENHKGRIRDMLGEWVRANAGQGILEKFTKALDEAGLHSLALELRPQEETHPTGDSSSGVGAVSQSSGARLDDAIPALNINNAKGCVIHIGTSTGSKADFHKDD